MKTCFKCNVSKPLVNFYKHSGMTDGYLGKCKECTKLDANNHRANNLEKIRQYDRDRAKNPDRMKVSIEINKAWRSEDKRRAKCHSAVARAIRSGELNRLPCVRCGEVKSLAHHEDYDEPLNVMWLCQPCHKQRHKEIKELI
jgi:ribosomal protein S27AE